MKGITIIAAVLVMPALAFGGATMTLIGLGGTNISHNNIHSDPAYRQDYRPASGPNCGLAAASDVILSESKCDMYQDFLAADTLDAQLFEAPVNTAMSAGWHLDSFYPVQDWLNDSTELQADAMEQTVQKVDMKSTPIALAPVFTIPMLALVGMLLLAGVAPFANRRHGLSK